MHDRGWDGWMASPTQWTWVWVNSGSWWWTGRPGVLRFMGSQRVGYDWETELNWPECSVTSVVSDSVILWTVARHTPLSIGLSRQGYWSGLPCPPGDLPNPGIKPVSPVFPALQAVSLPTESPAAAAASAAKSLQSCPTLCNPIDSSPPGSPVPGILQARTLEWVAIAFSVSHLRRPKFNY